LSACLCWPVAAGFFTPLFFSAAAKSGLRDDPYVMEKKRKTCPSFVVFIGMHAD
jgi:hypothetical protein